VAQVVEHLPSKQKIGIDWGDPATVTRMLEAPSSGTLVEA
jgi:hypothetical protein